MLPVVKTVLLTDEVVHIHQELRCGTGTAEHRADHEYHVDKAACKRLQVGRSRRVAADGYGTADEPGIHCDGGAIVGKARLVILIYKVVSQHVDVLVGQLLAVHLLNAVGQQATVQADEVRLGQLADERGNIFMLHVGVGVIF